MQVHAGCTITLKCHLVVFFLLSIYILFYSSRLSEAGYLLFKSYQHTNPCCASILHSVCPVFFFVIRQILFSFHVVGFVIGSEIQNHALQNC